VTHVSSNQSPEQARPSVLRRILGSWYAPAAVGLLLLIGLAVWVMPVPSDRVVTDNATGEVLTVTVWNTSRLQAVAAFWWQALLLALALVVVVIGVYSGRGWVAAKASGARFFAASLLLHSLLLLSLGAVPLARAVVEQVEIIRASQAAPPTDDDPQPVRPGGRPAFEKLADLRAENAVKPRLVRREAAPPTVPDAEALVPTIPLHAARSLPPERVRFVQPRQAELVRRPPEIARRSPAGALDPVELKLDMPELPPPETLPQERPIKDRPVTTARQEAVAPEVDGPEPLQHPVPKRPLQSGRVGAPVPRSSDTMPAFGPLAERLPRASGRTDRLARIEDKTAADAPLLLRQKDLRQRSVRLYGGTKESEAAVERGLAWLAAHQSANGSWSLNHFHANCKHAACGDPGTVISDPAGTGVALLPFLGSGNTPASGKHRQTVARALHWLVSQQRPDGSWLAKEDARPMYGHGIASIALCEAYGMTRDPKLRGPAQKALDYIVKAQHAATGGWRYTPNQPADTSVVGWQVMALKSGEMAGLSVPAKTFEGIKRWLASVEGNRPVGGLFGYQSANPTPAMTAQGLLCHQYLGARRDDQRMRAGTDYLLKHLPQPGAETSYYWYHATQVMYHMQGNPWKTWNGKMRDLLVSTQETRGTLAGSWKPVDAREKPGGRIYATALRVLMLEVYYRYLPLYQQLEK
jgi:hypothetical protein